jgi:hypothetical protein
MSLSVDTLGFFFEEDELVSHVLSLRRSTRLPCFVSPALTDKSCCAYLVTFGTLLLVYKTRSDHIVSIVSKNQGYVSSAIDYLVFKTVVHSHQR